MKFKISKKNALPELSDLGKLCPQCVESYSRQIELIQMIRYLGQVSAFR